MMPADTGRKQIDTEFSAAQGWSVRRTVASVKAREPGKAALLLAFGEKLQRRGQQCLAERLSTFCAADAAWFGRLERDLAEARATAIRAHVLPL
jgi:hypothetical protein